MPSDLTVSNSSCLIALTAAGYSDLLHQLYSIIDVPDAVARECGANLPAWVRVRSVQNRALVHSLRLQLGAGESEAIALALECSAARVILDDKKARKVAQQLQTPVTGTLAVLLRAKDQAILAKVRDALDALRGVGFHVAEALVHEVLKRASE